MKLFFISLLMCFSASIAMAQPSGEPAKVIKPGAKYIIYNTYYKKYLCTRGDKEGYAGLSAWGTNDSIDYVFTAIPSTTEGAYWLQQESTGKYLQGSNASGDTWSVWLTTNLNKSYNSFEWNLTPGDNGLISCLRAAAKYLGVDTGAESNTYVPVYYDKPESERSYWQFFAAEEDDGSGTLNKYGRYEILTDSIRTDELVLDSAIDYHVTSSTPMAETQTVKLNHEDAWLIFENVRPSKVVSTYLKNITINGVKATNGSNCRVVIYLDGAVVIPQNQTNYLPFIGYSENGLTGDNYNFFVGKNVLTSSDDANNRIRSFILKRGYMATVATTNDGSGYSRVFVADHKDLTIDLPTALSQRISYINIKKWNYCSKKGWSSTEGQSAINTESALVKATWFYTWSADKDNQLDMEYVPMNTHWNWPSVSTITNKTNATHMLGINEPEHSEQHTNCSCNNNQGGTTSTWNATTLTPRYAATGMRVGSPCPTDASWLTGYIGHVDDMAYRCDFVTFHAYWGKNEAADINSWKSQLDAIWNATHRPIWLTEFNNGASWTTETKPGYTDNGEKIKQIVTLLESLPYIERYCIYNWDDWHLAVLTWDSNKNNWWVNPAGQAYRDVKPHFAYNADYQKIPNWWGFDIQTGSSDFAVGGLSWNANTYKATLSVTNANIDQTKTLTLEYKTAEGTWLPFREITERELFDNKTFTINIDADAATLLPFYQNNPEKLTLRLNILDIKGKTATSAERSFNWPAYMEQTGVELPTIDPWANGQHYNVAGQRINESQPGIQIIKTDNRTDKIVIK